MLWYTKFHNPTDVFIPFTIPLKSIFIELTDEMARQGFSPKSHIRLL